MTGLEEARPDGIGDHVTSALPAGSVSEMISIEIKIGWLLQENSRHGNGQRVGYGTPGREGRRILSTGSFCVSNLVFIFV